MQAQTDTKRNPDNRNTTDYKTTKAEVDAVCSSSQMSQNNKPLNFLA